MDDDDPTTADEGSASLLDDIYDSDAEDEHQLYLNQTQKNIEDVACKFMQSFYWSKFKLHLIIVIFLYRRQTINGKEREIDPSSC